MDVPVLNICQKMLWLEKNRTGSPLCLLQNASTFSCLAVWVHTHTHRTRSISSLAKWRSRPFMSWFGPEHPHQCMLVTVTTSLLRKHNLPQMKAPTRGDCTTIQCPLFVCNSCSQGKNYLYITCTISHLSDVHLTGDNDISYHFRSLILLLCVCVFLRDQSWFLGEKSSVGKATETIIGALNLPSPVFSGQLCCVKMWHCNWDTVQKLGTLKDVSILSTDRIPLILRLPTAAGSLWCLHLESIC